MVQVTVRDHTSLCLWRNSARPSSLKPGKAAEGGLIFTEAGVDKDTLPSRVDH
jgi:hypothetical protein